MPVSIARGVKPLFERWDLRSRFNLEMQLMKSAERLPNKALFNYPKQTSQMACHNRGIHLAHVLPIAFLSYLGYE